MDRNNKPKTAILMRPLPPSSPLKTTPILQRNEIVNNLLKKIPHDEFITRCRQETSSLICRIYLTDSLSIEHNTIDGSLYFPLVTDVFTLVDCQIALLREYGKITNDTSSLFLDISSFLFENLRYKQLHFRNDFLKDLEYCCAASNTFLKMGDRCEEMLTMLLDEFDDEDECKEYESQFRIAQNHCSELSLLYRADAIYSAQYTHIYIFQSIREIYFNKLFSVEWEVKYLENEISLSIVRTLTEFWMDMKRYLSEDMLLETAALSLIESCVVFYTEVIFLRAKNENKQDGVRCRYFTDPIEALQRLFFDIQLLKDFFRKLPVAMNVLEHRLAVLVVIYKCIKLWLESPNDVRTMAHLFSVLDSFTGNSDLTHACMEDLFYLFAPINAHFLDALKRREAESISFNPRLDRRQVPGLKVNVVLSNIYNKISIKPQTKRKPKTSRHTKQYLTRPKSIVNFMTKGSKRNNIFVLPQHEGIDLCFLPDAEVCQNTPVPDMFQQFLGSLPPEEFLSRFHVQCTDLIERVYANDHTIDAVGQLTIQLASDTFSIVHSQLQVVYQYLKSTDSIVSIYRKEIVVKATCFLLESLRFHQIHFRDLLLKDFDYCCAVSNDFSAMATLCEDFVAMLHAQGEASSATDHHASELILLYFEDAVYSAQYTHIYVFEPIRQTIMDKLFRLDWEESLTHNELARSIISTIDDFKNDLETYLSDEYLVIKALHAILEATILFYFESLVLRAKKRRLFRNGYFTVCDRALRRFQDDIEVFKNYFSNLGDKYPNFERYSEIHFSKLQVVHDLLCTYRYTNIGAEMSENEIEMFIPKMLDLVGDAHLTKCCMSDLYNLFDPMQRSHIWKVVSKTEQKLRLLNDPKDSSYSRNSYNRRNVPRLTFYSVLQEVYHKDLKKSAITKYHKYKKRATDVGVLTYTKEILKHRAKRVMLSSFEIAVRDVVHMVDPTDRSSLISKAASSFDDVSYYVEKMSGRDRIWCCFDV